MINVSHAWAGTGRFKLTWHLNGGYVRFGSAWLRRSHANWHEFFHLVSNWQTEKTPANQRPYQKIHGNSHEFNHDLFLNNPDTWNSMMTSPNGNIFRVIGLSCGEFTGDAEIWCFLRSPPEQRLSKQSRRRRFETPSRSLWRHSSEGS